MLVVLTGAPPLEARGERRWRAFLHLAQAAQDSHLKCVLTSPRSLLAAEGRMNGWLWQTDEGTWKQTSVRLRRVVVYDAMYLADLKRYRDDYRNVLLRCARLRWPVFNPVLPSKDFVFRLLGRHSGGESGYATPRTWFHVTPEQVFDLLGRHRIIWLKPTLGSGGRNMMQIRLLDDGRYQVSAERFYGRRVRGEVSKTRLARMMRLAFQHRQYMVQEHIPLLETGERRPVDLRVTVMRNTEGNWVVAAVTGRVGAPGSRLTNYHAGGQVISLTQNKAPALRWLESVGLGTDDVHRAEDTALAAAHVLSRSFANLGILGVDVGITQEGRQYVYDCNGRPGRDILTDDEVQSYMHHVCEFTQFLMQRTYHKRLH